MSVTVNGTSGLVFGDGTIQGTAAGMPFRNRIINGDMRIDQRYAGAAISSNGVGANYAVDRTAAWGAQSGKFSVQQNQGGVTPPVGFTKYIGVTSLTANSPAANDYFLLQQVIEGLNIADLAWGTANAATVTLSFWVRSSLTGTFSGALRNGNTINRCYVYTYNINSANTWEYKTITIQGDTSGTWATDNTSGMLVCFDLGCGSSYQGVVGSWAANDDIASASAVKVLNTSGATFYITGVQLEKAAAATTFEYRPIQTELAMCQRYFYKTYPQSVVAPSASTYGCLFTFQVSGNGAWNARFPVTMRSQPTCYFYDLAGTVNKVTFSTTHGIAGGINPQSPGDSGCMVFTNSASGQAADGYVQLIANAEL